MNTIALLAAVAALDWTMPDGSVVSETRELLPFDGGMRLVVSREQLRSMKAKRLTVTPDFATAKKGEDGYWVMPDNTFGTYRIDNGRAYQDWHVFMPMFGMKTPRMTYCAIVTGMPHSLAVEVRANDGVYAQSAVFLSEKDIEFYEDVRIDYHFLTGDDADYSGIARCYRKYQLERGAAVPLAEKAKGNPELSYAVTNIEVRIRQAWKPAPSPVMEQVTRNEPPVKPVVTFDRVKEIVDESRRQGVGGAEFCLVGWNRGGHDGSYPQIFPVEPSLGGEEKLKECIRHAQASGYQIVGHSSFRDCYMIADTWDSEYVVEKNPDGSLKRGETSWSGGRLYTMCPQRAYERFCPKQCAEMKTLGFKGLFYVDVTTSRPLFPCPDARHRLDNGQRTVWENNIMREIGRTFGGAASEGAYDFCSRTCESALTVQWVSPFDAPRNPIVDGYIPLWQLVYHGIIVSTPFRTMINCPANPDRRYALKLAEFGGRPTFYWHSIFVTGASPSMGLWDLEATTDEKMRQGVAWMKEGFDEFAGRSHLQLCFMDRHEKIADGVFRTTYSNGESIVVNYGSSATTVDGIVVPPLSSKLVAATPPAFGVTELSDWEFRRDGDSWRSVSVPHDWSIAGPFDRAFDVQVVAIVENGETNATEKTGRTGALPWIGEGEYRRRVDIPEGAEWAELEFDGVMSMPEVFLDGERIGGWKYGYSPFKVELPRSGVVTVKVKNLPQSSRWYPGAGIYRPVCLRWGGRVGMVSDGLTILTPDLETVSASVELRNPDNAPVDVRFRVLDADGRCVAEGASPIKVKGARTWSPESPYLYTLETSVAVSGKIVGSRRDSFGFRTVSCDSDGFRLNGVRRKFKGVCLHHDLGPIGAAFSKDAFRRQVALLKEMGCNAIRTSHNTPARGVLEVCDEMGIMVVAETFDSWRMPKCANGYNLFYDDWWEKDLEQLVRLGRNHPCVVMWSVGNEVPEQHVKAGAAMYRAMQDHVHALDADRSRPVTAGMSSMPQAIENGIMAEMDVPAVTYRLPFYSAIRDASASNRVVLGIETASTVSSRGTYKFPVVEAKNAIHPDRQCSGYDVECCFWSNLPDDDWAMQEDNDWTLGEFVWTGFDYLGEPTPYDGHWPSRSSYFGIFDLAGLPKDRYWLYRAHWNKESPTLHICPSHWNFKGREGEVTPVYVYTSWPEAELFINGISQGRRKFDKSSRLDRFRLRWNDVVYEPGEICAVAYDRDGREAATCSIRTTGKAVGLKTVSVSRYGELAYFHFALVDADGNIVPDDDRTVVVEAVGGMRLRGMCNGDATSLESLAGPTMKTFRGELVAVGEGATGELCATLQQDE